MSYTLTDIAVFLVCSVISAMGMGGGGILILYLVSLKGLPQLGAQGINLLFFLPSCLISVIIYIKNKYIDLRSVVPMLLGAAVGVGIGRLFLTGINARTLRLAFACFLIVSGLFMIFGRKKKVDK